MLFAARSLSFPQADVGTEGLTVLPSALSGQLPWFVLTLLDAQKESAAWETVCACKEKDLLDYLTRRPTAQLAELFYMAPPRWSGRNRWSRHSITHIERGRCQGREVSVYHVKNGGQFCFDAPNIEPADVTHRKSLLEVRWYRHFE